jgi:hypothetical protein
VTALWFDDDTDPLRWHVSVERLGGGRYRMACGIEMRIRHARGMWPTKPREIGPPREDRCPVCAQARP